MHNPRFHSGKAGFACANPALLGGGAPFRGCGPAPRPTMDRSPVPICTSNPEGFPTFFARRIIVPLISPCTSRTSTGAAMDRAQRSAVHVRGGVGIGVTDRGGSGKASLMAGTESASSMRVLSLGSRSGGSTAFQIKLDFGGLADGAGSPTIADGALFRYEQASGSLKPWNVILRTIQAQDENGDPVTLQVICPP